jgi:hypothetical protein
MPKRPVSAELTILALDILIILLYQYLLQIRQSWFSGAQESVSRLSARRSFEEEPAGERWTDDDFHCRKVGAPQPPVTRIIGAPQPRHLRRIDYVRDKFELIDGQQYIDLERSHEDRNRCAHPSLQNRMARALL